MGCHYIALPGGSTAIACTRGQSQRKCVECGGTNATQACDWKLNGRKAGQTCDRHLCRWCAVRPAPGVDKDLCQAHARAWEKWKSARDAAEGDVA